MKLMISINLVDFLTRRNSKEVLLNILESENCTAILQQIKDAGATTEFLTEVSDTFDDESEITMKFFTNGAFENLADFFGMEDLLGIFGLAMDLPGNDSLNDFQDTPELDEKICDKCVQSAPENEVKDGILTSYFDWHPEATFDVLGNNRGTVSGRLINGNTVEVYCKSIHPVLKLNVLHVINMGAIINPAGLYFNIEDGVLRIALIEQPKEVILF